MLAHIQRVFYKQKISTGSEERFKHSIAAHEYYPLSEETTWTINQIVCNTICFTPKETN
jgi:hypothetical protein